MITLYKGDAFNNREILLDLLLERGRTLDPQIKYIVKEPLLKNEIEKLLLKRGRQSLTPNPVVVVGWLFNNRQNAIHPALSFLFLEKILQVKNADLELLCNIEPKKLVPPLIRLFSEFQAVDLCSEDLSHELQGALDTPKNRDIVRIYTAFLEDIRNKGFKGKEALIWDALYKVEFPKPTTIIFDGFYNLSSYDRALIEKLDQSGFDLHINFPTNWNKGTLEEPQSDYLFLKEKAGRVQATYPRKVKKIRVVETKTPEKEVNFVLKAIKELAREKSIDCSDDVVILSNNPDFYDVLFKNACKKEGLEFRPRSVNLDQTAIIRELTLLVTFMSRPLEKEELYALLMGKYCDFAAFLGEFAQVEAALILDRIKLTGKSSMWFRKLEILADKFEDASKLLQILYGLQSMTSWGLKKLPAYKIADLFLELLQKLRIRDNLVLDSSFDRNQILELRAYQEALNELSKMSEAAKKEYFISGSFLQNWLHTLKFSTLSISKDGLSIQDLNEAPVITGKYVFVLGLNEDELPSRSFDFWLFDDRERQIINKRLLYPLSLARDKERLQDYLYYEALRAGSEGVYLSYYRQNLGSFKEPSRYIDGLEDFGIVSDAEKIEPKQMITSQASYKEYCALEKKLDVFEGKLQKRMLSYDNYSAEEYYFPELGYKKNEPEGDRQLSVSRFEKYLDCPYRFFAEEVLGLFKEDSITHELTFLESGSLWHEILEKYYRGLQGFSPYKFDENRFDALVESVFSAKKADEFYKEAERKRYYTKIKDYLKRDSMREGFKPYLLERQMELDLGPYTLKGVIDRVDYIDEKAGKGYFVIDYKRSASSLQRARGINAFQLVSYIWSLVKHELTPVLGGKLQSFTGEEYFLCNRIADEIFGRRVLRTAKDQGEFEEHLGLTIDENIIKAQEMFEGYYYPNYESYHCAYCQFCDLCKKPTRDVSLENEA